MRKVKLDKTRVKVAMAMKGIDDYSQLAKQAGMHYNNVYKMVKTGRFSVDSISALAEALDVNPIDLLVTPGFPPPNLAAPAHR